MKTLRTVRIWSAATVAILAFPPLAAAAYLVPPGNSAANQYTETYPTAGGQNDANKGARIGGRSPASVLGNRNARRLEARGEAGRAAAAVAAATAPNSIPQGGAQAPSANNRDASHQRPDVSTRSSGLDEVIVEATGSSGSGQMGLLLPLVIVGAFSWSIAYLLRQRKKPTA
jgi:hypothetical protein